MSAGKQVLLYLVDGGPGGLRTAEIANWTGHIVAVPRSDVGRLLSRDESSRTGVYLLIGEDQESLNRGSLKVYIGEGDDVAARIRKHVKEKEWWDRAIVITSQAQAQQLTKSQVRFLEAELIKRVRATGRATLDNGTNPGFAKLSEAETSNMNYFLEQLYVLLPVVGVDVFRGKAHAPAGAAVQSPASSSPVFHLVGRKQGVEARAQLIDGEFIVLEGSTAVAGFVLSDTYSSSTARAYAAYAEQHSDLIERGVLVREGSVARFAKDAPFGSPSTAGAIVFGRSCNGRTSWLTDSGMSYGAWESRDATAPSQEATS